MKGLNALTSTGIVESPCTGYFSSSSNLKSHKWKTHSSNDNSKIKPKACQGNSLFGDKYNLKVGDDEQLLKSAEKISQELFKTICNPEPKSEMSSKVVNLLRSYKKPMTDFSTKFEEWSEVRDKNIRNLQNLVEKFHMIKQATSKMTLLSLSLDVFTEIASLTHSLLDFKFSSNYPLAMSVVSGVSIISSLIALSYSNQTIKDIIRDIRNEKYLMRDLELIFRKGNWIDQEIQELFPHGIDLELVKKIVFDRNVNLVESWRQQVLTAIIFTNIRKDRKLLSDVNFFTSAKVFSESMVAEIWTNRIKLRHLLDDMTGKLESLPDKKSISENGVFVNQAALNLYPVLFPLFFHSGSLQKMKLLCTSMAAMTAAVNLSDSDTEEFDDLKKTCKTLQEDYKHSKKIIESVFNEYD